MTLKDQIRARTRSRYAVAWRAAQCWLPIALALCSAESSPGFQVPDGFVIERVAGPPRIRFPMFATFDDQGQLYVTESSGGDLYQELIDQVRACRISVLADRDGDGHFEQNQVFADGLVPSMGLCWRDGKLYAADPPDLVTLEDTDGDGKADRRRVLLTGFGHRDNGSLHGLTFGPDGLLYMTMGWPDGFRIPRGDGTFVSGTTGALLRCRADGSNIEVLCRGFDQLVEVVFLPTGEMIGSQTWYQNPSGGIRDSLTHLVPGGLYPQRWRDEQPIPFTTGVDALPAILLMPATAHSGLARYRGTMFPPAYRDAIFSAEFNTRKVVVHRLTRVGATFRSDTEDFLTTDDPDFRPSDVIEDADGSLLVIDTGSWYVQHCPTGRMRATSAPGAIYRIRPSAAAASPDPRGRTVRWASLSPADLVKHLHDPRPAVRDRAIEWLVARGAEAAGPLIAWLRSTEESAAIATSALWALARIDDDAARQELRRTLAHTNLTWAATAARALALHPHQTSAPALEKLLAHPDASVRMAVAESLAVCGRPESAVTLFLALETSPDRMLEHALINALRSIGSLDAFRTALVHPNPQVQKAALLLLDQAPHRTLTANDVLAHLASANAPLRQVARFRLAQHIEWAPAAAEFVREHLLAPVLAPEDERTMAELLLAFQDAAPFATLVADALAQPDTVVGIPGKVLLLDFLAKTTRTPWPDIWTANLHSALAHSENSVRLSAIHAVASAQTDAWDSALERIAANTAESAELRVEALSVLARRSPDLSPPAWHFLLSQLATANPFLTRIRAAEVLASARPPPETLRRFISAAAADPSISPTLVLSSVQRAGLDASTTVLLLPYLERCVRRGYPLNEAEAEQVIRAAPVRGLESVESLRHAVQEQARVRQALFQQYRPLLTGGHPTRGRDLFFDKAGCHACHQVGTEGRAAGPDLTKLGAIRSPDDILESVLLPSATLAQGYDTFVAELANGDTITGNLVGETEETVTLRNATGIEARILRGQIDSLERSPLSLMPEGLLQALTEQEAADLLAFLLDLR